MLHLHGQVRNITAVATSGGPDSMAALSFLRRNNPSVMALYFHHGTIHGEEAYQFLKSFCEDQKIKLVVGQLTSEKPKDSSWEEFWREERYKFLHSFKEHLIATAHHLNDVAETYLWGCLHGKPRFIHYRQPGPNGPTNIVRPFLLTPKEELINWCERHRIPHIQDPSNFDTDYTRNRIRQNLMPEVAKINPGFLTTVKKLLQEQLIEDGLKWKIAVD